MQPLRPLNPSAHLCVSFLCSVVTASLHASSYRFPPQVQGRSLRTHGRTAPTLCIVRASMSPWRWITAPKPRMSEEIGHGALKSRCFCACYCCDCDAGCLSWMCSPHERQAESENEARVAPRIPDSKLPEPVQDFIKLICDVGMMKKQMVQFELDTDKMPLGALVCRFVCLACSRLTAVLSQARSARRRS